MQETKTTSKVSTQDILAPLQVTIIANLPDSLQPKTIVLESMPKPLTVAVPNKKEGFYSVTNSKGEITKINLEATVIKSLSVLQNKKGEPILDKDGKPFIMEDGHLAQVLNYLKAYKLEVGLLINFGSKSLTIKRLVL